MDFAKCVAIVAVLFLGGCDTFFVVRGTVIDSTTSLPIGGADVELVLDRGAGEPDQLTETKPDGSIELWMNEPRSAWATLTIRKDGYETWSQQFRGSPKNGLEIYLRPQNSNSED